MKSYAEIRAKRKANEKLKMRKLNAKTVTSRKARKKLIRKKKIRKLATQFSI